VPSSSSAVAAPDEVQPVPEVPEPPPVMEMALRSAADALQVTTLTHASTVERGSTASAGEHSPAVDSADADVAMTERAATTASNAVADGEEPTATATTESAAHDEMSRLEEQAAEFAIRLHRTEKQLEAKRAESLRLEAKMNDLNAMVERERRQKEKYRALASASASVQGSYGAPSSAMREHAGAPNAPGAGSALGGAGPVLDSASSGLGGTSAGAPGMENVLREARRELEAVKATHRQISLEIMLRQHASIPSVGCSEVPRWSADASTCASSCPGAHVPRTMQMSSLSATSALSGFPVGASAGHSTLMGSAPTIPMTTRGLPESARPSTPPAVAPLSAEPSVPT